MILKIGKVATCHEKKMHVEFIVTGLKVQVTSAFVKKLV